MRHHFTYKLLMLAAVLSAAFVFTACNADGGQTKEETTAAQTPESMEAVETAATEEETDTTESDMGAEETMNEESDGQSADGQMVFTLEELSKYNGKDGMPAYVAVDGVVYDVSDKTLWAGGEHQNRVSAGRDLSEAILQSPHGKAKLEELPIVGVLAEE